MIINTLGPVGSDSYRVAKTLIDVHDEINIYSSFDEIIAKIDDMENQYILIPTAYRSALSEYDWKDFNFEYWERMDLANVFHRKTKIMMLVENAKFKKDCAIIHPATSIYMKKYIAKQYLNSKIEFASSKCKAYERFVKFDYRFTIASEDNISFKNSYKIIKKIQPEMVWCVYKVREKK
ncbi:hypothetical protein [Enterococcus rotai]|uniref:hypothetical protein n=1 Tax=Enterococcus rotai TaxID=118060 RepID=UPI0032B5EA45